MTNADEFLAHYGKKGMKWGVVNDDDDASSSNSKSDSKTPKSGVGGSAAAIKKLSPEDQKKVTKAAAELNAFAEKNGPGAKVLGAKYGNGIPDAAPPDTRNFYQRNKTAINVGAGLAVAGLAAYGGYKYHENVQKKSSALQLERQDELKRKARKMMEEDEARAFAAKSPEEQARIRKLQSEQESLNSLMGDYNRKVQDKIIGQFDPKTLDTNPVNLPAGKILKRISMDDEKTVRSGGFYASHDDDDVERYKAVLPTYWKQWGKSNTDGYVVNLRADKPVKAPSQREAYDIYSEMLRTNPDFRKTVDPFNGFRTVSPEVMARNTYRQMSTSWLDDKNPAVGQYFNEVKKRGYNALVDENDAGSLSKQPLRLLDGEMFSLQPSSRLTEQEIGETQIREAEKIKKNN